jgi:DNA-binding protein
MSTKIMNYQLSAYPEWKYDIGYEADIYFLIFAHANDKNIAERITNSLNDLNVDWDQVKVDAEDTPAYIQSRIANVINIIRIENNMEWEDIVGDSKAIEAYKKYANQISTISVVFNKTPIDCTYFEYFNRSLTIWRL